MATYRMNTFMGFFPDQNSQDRKFCLGIREALGGAERTALLTIPLEGVSEDDQPIISRENWERWLNRFMLEPTIRLPYQTVFEFGYGKPFQAEVLPEMFEWISDSGAGAWSLSADVVYPGAGAMLPIWRTGRSYMVVTFKFENVATATAFKLTYA